ncbi:MAG TPA: VOC family protein [Solirubrobacteraceae bacterium]|nr:VOC family protein [Solirubrobacteraceae bacterium]
MNVDGLHHVTCITGDAPRNLDFYVRVMAMRLVKKTVNQDDPTVYHLFYGDEEGSPGFDLTFFEYPGARRGRHGDGMVHTVVFRVPREEALGFWAQRLAAEGVESVPTADGALRFADPDGLGLELRVEDVPDRPLPAVAPDVPEEDAIVGFAGVRAYSSDPEDSAPLLRALGMREDGDRWEARGDLRGGWIRYEEPPAERGLQGAGTVHHIAWAIPLGDEDAWQSHVTRAGARATPVIDRFYFRSIYFREPSGVLFELATMGPGFAVDEDPEHLGERLALPPFLEPNRERIEAAVTPLPPLDRFRREAVEGG